MLKNGRTLRTDAKLILRGISEFNRILPGQLRLLSANAVLTALAPYVAIVLSAKIITELTGARDINKLVLYVLLATGMTFLLTAVGAKLKAKIAVGYSLLFRAHELHLNSKAYDIDYAKLEDPDFRALRDQVTGNISSTGAGMASLYWDIEIVVTNLCSVIVACILSGGDIYGKREWIYRRFRSRQFRVGGTDFGCIGSSLRGAIGKNDREIL